MKKFKALLAIVAVCAVVVSMCMTVFAEDIMDSLVFDVDSKDFTGAAGDKITVSVYSGANSIDVIQAGSMHVIYETSKWTYDSIAYNTEALTSLASKEVDTAGDIAITFNANAGIIIPANTKIADLTFTAKTADSTSNFVLNHNEAWDLYSSDGETYYDYNDTLAVTQKAAQAEEEVVDATKISEGTETIFGKENSYWGVWVGTYSVTPGAKSIKKATVSFAEAGKTFETGAIAADGPGAVEFKVAIVGVPAEYATGSAATVTLQ